MNKVVDNLLKNVEEFEIFFNEYEKQFYPEIRKARKMLLLFLCLLIVCMFGDLILLRFFSDSSYWKVSLIITLIILFFFGIYARKFNKVSVGAPSKFTELCNEVKSSLNRLYGVDAEKVAKMLVSDLNNKRNEQIQKYENVVKSIGAIGMILVTAFITLSLNKLFVTDTTAISVDTFLGLIIFVFVVVLLIRFIDYSIKNIIKYPPFGKASKEVYLSDVLSVVKYTLLEKEQK